MVEELKLATLGDYRDICVVIGGEDCEAVKFLDRRIAEQGRDEKVLAPESQMMFLLGPMLVK
jgi:hypothetical protein